MSAGFEFNEVELNGSADASKIGENFTKLENLGITDAKATRLASTTQNGWMSSSDKTKLDSLTAGANGTITQVAAGTGLTGGGNSGAVTLSVAYGTTSSTVCAGNDSRLSDNRNPISHASSSTNYGVGSGANYGHCKTINNLNSASYVDGEALSAYQGNVLNTNKLDVSAKATTQEAQTGINDTKYMTPLSTTNAIISRISSKESTKTYSEIFSTDTFVTKSKSFTTNARFIFIDAKTNGRVGSDEWGLYDCVNNVFLFVDKVTPNGTYRDNFYTFKQLFEFTSVLDYGYGYGYIENFAYNNGTLSFDIRGRVTSSSSLTINLTCIPLDGLMV